MIPRVLVLVGPVGGGLELVLAGLLRRGRITLHPVWTDRPMRIHEIGEPEARMFAHPGEFDIADETGFFVATARNDGEPFRYGIPGVSSWDADMIDTVVLPAGLVGEFTQHIPDVVVYCIDAPGALLEERISSMGLTKAEQEEMRRYNSVESALGSIRATRVWPKGVRSFEIEDVVDQVEEALSGDFGTGDEMKVRAARVAEASLAGTDI